MVHQGIPDPTAYFAMMVMYLGVICIAYIVFLLVRWWRRKKGLDSRGRRSYSKELAARLRRKNPARGGRNSRKQ